MSSYDEKIRARKASDQEMFSDSLLKIADSVISESLRESLNENRIGTTDALSAILKYFRIRTGEVPENVEDIQDLMDCYMNPHGIMHCNLKLEGNWDRHAMGPMLGRRKDNGNIIALLPAGIHGYVYYDAKKKVYIPINAKNRDLIDSEVIVFFKPFPKTVVNTKTLLKFMFAQIPFSDIWALLLLIIFIMVLGMLMPALNKRLFSDVLDTSNIRLLTGVGLFMLSISISSGLLAATKALLGNRIMVKMYVYTYSATMMRILSLPVSFFRNFTAGDLSNRIDVMGELSNEVAYAFFITGLSGVFSLAYIGQVIFYAPSLVWPALIVTVLNLLVTLIAVILQAKVNRKLMLISSHEKGMRYQLINGVQKIRLSGASKRAFAKWGSFYSAKALLDYNPPLLLKVAPVLTSGISMIGVIVIYALAIKNHVSVAEYYAFNTAYGSLSVGMAALASIAASIARIRPSVELIQPILTTVSEDEGNRMVITSLSGEIELNNVTFRYDKGPAILNNISFKINPGEYVAITGKSGSGKSTLMRILLGFENPKTGAVYYDGRDLQDINLRSIRRKIGTVMQDGKLFGGTIYENIATDCPDLSEEDAWEAAEIAGIADDIRRMPKQMNTLITEGGGSISGGQRQRLLIARAIAPKPRILFMDEATSALDNETQKKVSEALDRLNSTRVVIAHRLSTIRQCDRIIVVDNGSIVEDGTYDELIEKGGFFAELVSRQQL